MTHSHDLRALHVGDRPGRPAQQVALIGRQPRGDLNFEPVADFRTPESTFLRRLFMFLVDQLGSSQRNLPP
jgi:hypothetical protein